MSKLINEASIPMLLQEMSAREKIDLLTGGSAFSSPAMPKYGIPSVLYLDGATGVNMLQYVCELAGSFTAQNPAQESAAAEATQALDSQSSNESGGSTLHLMPYIVSDTPLPDTFPAPLKNLILAFREKIKAIRPNGEEPGCFPPGMLLGATWNPQVVYQIGEAVAREAIAYGVDILLGTPNVNIHRDPRNGRLFESFSEDPYLSARMAPSFVKGVQDQGMVADVKHFAANNQETLRQGINEQISERALREIYLPGFEAAVKEGNVETVMSAYNSINGIPCAQNTWLLTDVLKKEWGFQGQVVSDWGAVYDQVVALNAGNDMDMPGPRGKQKLYEAAENGELDMRRLDDAVARTLRMILKTPAFLGRRYTAIDNELSRQAAYRAAAEGITLLKNDGVLPLKKDERIALFGRLTDRFMESGSGSAQVDTSKTTHLPEECARYTHTILRNEIRPDTDAVIITVGASGQEGKDRPGMVLDTEDDALLRSALKQAKAQEKKTVVLLNVSGPEELTDLLPDIDSLICLFFPGMEGARATADILFGHISPSGKLPLTFPKTIRDTPTAFNFPGEYGKVNYGEGIFVGYRYYDFKGIEPLYPFGFGLSYSAFEITDVRISETIYDNEATHPLVVSVTVKNTGSFEASEVVQLYLHAKSTTLQKPDRELKAFAKVDLIPGEEKTVTLSLLPKAFSSYDTDLQAWAAEPGHYDLLIGNSSRNIVKLVPVTLTGRNPYGLSLRSAISAIASKPAALSACVDALGKYFDAARLRSNVNYFGSTRLDVYLEKSIPEAVQKTEEWAMRLKRLEDLLADVDKKH